MRATRSAGACKRAPRSHRAIAGHHNLRHHQYRHHTDRSAAQAPHHDHELDDRTYDDVAVQYSKGRVTQIVDQATTIKFTYDQVGRTTQTQRIFLRVWQTMSQTYDALSRITTENFPDGEQVTYNYNTAGWLQSVIATVGPNYINDIQYNARGARKRRSTTAIAW